MMRSVVQTFLVIALIIGATQSLAEAFPHFQFSSETETCGMCHVASEGGGLLTGWGRDEAADTLSLGGDGAFLHGAWEPPDWLTLGGDVRLAALGKLTGESEDPTYAIFPMQFDVAARVSVKKWAALVNVGVRGQARSASLPANSSREEGDILSRLVSRQHHLSYEATDNTSLQAGRFYAPYGLRLPDHTSYIRRYLGFNLLEETYGLGMHHLAEESDYHATVHVSDTLRGRDEAVLGATAMAEWRREAAAIGTSMRVTNGANNTRALVSTHYKRWFADWNLLWMSEVDAGWQRFTDSKDSRFQLAAYAGPVWFPTKGLSVSLAYELFDEDVQVQHVKRHAATAWISFLPRAHYEVLYMTRAERIGTRDGVLTGIFQLHYYL